MTSVRVIAWAVAVLLSSVLPATVSAQPNTPTQRGYIQNQTLRSQSAASVASITIAAVTNQRVRLYGIVASCTGGAYASLLVLDGTSNVWNTSASYVTPNSTWTTFPTPLTGGLGNSMRVEMSACTGQAGSIGQISIQADQWGP